MDDQQIQEELGPQWREIQALIQKAESLTDEEIKRVNFEGADLTAEAHMGSGDSIRALVAIAGLKTDQVKPTATLEYPLSKKVRCEPFAPAWAIAALGVRHLIGVERFTQNHYNTLTMPWRKAIGPIHPDDRPIEPTKGPKPPRQYYWRSMARAQQE